MDTSLLLDRIKASGYKRSYLAKEMGISAESLRRKLNGLSEFTASEIGLLCTLLRITPSEAAAIFYPAVLN